MEITRPSMDVHCSKGAGACFVQENAIWLICLASKLTHIWRMNRGMKATQFWDVPSSTGAPSTGCGRGQSSSAVRYNLPAGCATRCGNAMEWIGKSLPRRVTDQTCRSYAGTFLHTHTDSHCCCSWWIL